MTVPDYLRRAVVHRADDRCEYCLLSQFSQEATFHTDHIIPQSADGPTTMENLALACVSCSLRKGARQTAPDPQTSAEVPLFNPRHDVWQQHFCWEGVKMIGLTPIGRATVEALQLNRQRVLEIRFEDRERGRLPFV